MLITVQQAGFDAYPANVFRSFVNACGTSFLFSSTILFFEKQHWLWSRSVLMSNFG
jgi:hypothetical protein